MADPSDRGQPVSYLVLEEGTRVESQDGEDVGTVRHVLADEGSDVFDGLILDTAWGGRFVPGADVGDLYERRVELALTRDQVESLQPPEPSPAVMEARPDDVAEEGPGERAREVARRAWDRISGNY